MKIDARLKHNLSVLGVVGLLALAPLLAPTPSSAQQETQSVTPATTPPSAEGEAPPPQPPRMGQEAPAIQLETPEGGTITLRDLRGKVVLLDFWASWCVPCVRAVPHLQRMDRSFPPEHFVLLGVNVDDSLDKLRDFTASHQLTWPQGWDPERRVVDAFGVENFPTYVLIDPQGTVIYRRSGWTPTMGPLLHHRVRAAVAEAMQSRATPPASLARPDSR